jgi:hypothetical protein
MEARSKVRHAPKGRGDSSPVRSAGFTPIRKTRQPLRHIHECVLGILALESEPVDPPVVVYILIDTLIS